MAESKNITLGEAVLQLAAELEEVPQEQLYQQMAGYLEVMQAAVDRGVNEEVHSLSGLSGGAARLLAGSSGKLFGGVARKAMAYALAVIEVNAAMGKIVAAPTAGSSGILPGVLLAVGEELQAPAHPIVLALFAAAGVGQVIGQVASLSGAEGGCQAECGSASAMAAVGAVQLAGGSAGQAVTAGALALKNSLGMSCDPVAGLVEVPCVKRNALQALSALGAAELALSGVQSVIPLDEVIAAMGQIGRALPRELKETALGGLAQTKTAQEISKRLFQSNDDI
jgi:L-serine dehydratase